VSLKLDTLFIHEGIIYRIIKVDDEKGLYLAEKRMPKETMPKKIVTIIEHSGWDIVKVVNDRAKVVRDDLAKRMEKKKGAEEE
jgi:hypothetical protein